MKQKMSILLIGLMLMVGLPAFGMVPAVINEPGNEVSQESVPFEVTQDGDEFTIIIESNPSTGFAWAYKIEKEDHVSFVDESYIEQEAAFTFKVLGEGVSTITFTYAQPWVGEAEKTLNVLVYKTDDKLFVEEDHVVSGW
jgi:predicted secreted protein